MINIKALAVATALSAGITFTIPVATSQAMPVGPVKIQTVKDDGIVNVHSKKKWSKKRWARYCRWADDWRCYRRHRHARLYRYRYYDPYYDPYYYNDFYGYNNFYRPRWHGSGLGLFFRFD